jgi:hypothetical protein
MDPHEFTLTVKENGQLELPQTLTGQLKPGQQVRLLVMLDDNEDEAWMKFTMQQFLNGYADIDAIYDTLE